MRMQEYSGNSAVGSRKESAPVGLSCLWQPVTLDVTASLSGSTLDLQIVDVPTLPGETFFVDAVSVKIPGSPTVVARDFSMLAPLVPSVAPDPLVEPASLRFATSRPGGL